MKSPLQRHLAATLGAMAISVSAQVVNDGTTTDGLAKLANQNGTGDAVAEIARAEGGKLQAALVVEGAPSFALRQAWYSRQFHATQSSYSVSAEFKPAAVETERRGGVMGWINTATLSGIAFYTRPAGNTASFRVAHVQFTADVANENESAQRLFNLDGSPASFAFDSAGAALGTYDPSLPARFILQFQPPGDADKAALADATARIKATVEQLDASGKVTVAGRVIELLTNLEIPSPLNHRFGYFGYWGLLAGAGPIGLFDDLRAEGSISPSANLPPTIKLTQPADTVDAIAPATLTLSAEASDPDGQIARVEFLDGAQVVATVLTPSATNLVGEKHSFVYTAIWTNIQAGAYEVRARAVDDLGALALSTLSTLVFVETNIPPSVNLVKPAVDASFKAPALVEIAATATDADGKVVRVDFLGNGILLASLTSPPYITSWDLRTPGTNKLFVRAIDDRGASNETPVLTLTAVDNLPPKSLVTSPATGATFKAPANIKIVANVSDSDGQVMQAIAFFNIHEQIGVVTAPIGGGLPPVVSFDWNNVPAGQYTLDVVAIDHQGIRTTSPAVEITVTPGDTPGGTGPALLITAQADNNLAISWPSGQSGFRLQGSPTLDPATWTDVPASNNRASVAASGASRYFRLIKP